MKIEEWNNIKTKVFWGEIAPTDHVVQIYEDKEVFINSLEMFVTGGLEKSECVIVIATLDHLKALEYRLIQHGFDPKTLIEDELFIPLDAEKALARFMVNGWPDELLFKQMVLELVAKARRRNRQIRAFGEMVALLWAKGHNGATVQLENLWSKFCETEAFCLFCAYPKSGFTQDVTESIHNICSCHSKVLAGWNTSKTEIYYRSAVPSKV